MKDLLLPMRRIHGRLHDRQIRRKEAVSLYNRIHSAPSSTLYFVLTPTHGNLGDHAIAQSSSTLLRKMGQDYEEITTKQLLLLSEFNRLNAFNGHPVLINGGGNLGTLWFAIEKLFRKLIQENFDSPMLCLPNTIFYENSSFGKAEQEISQKIYNTHPSLKICAREKHSYDIMTSLYRDIALVPDMALFLNKSRHDTKRHGCLLCLRNDIEKTRTASEEQEIYSAVRSLFGNSFVETDMVADHGISPEQRDEELERKFDQFRRAELVVTDRLHGMIFSAITGTPCIVLDSKSPKVRGCYEWIRDLPYIRFADSPAQITSLYSEIPQGPHFYQTEPLLPYYEDLMSYISDLTHEVS